ncbi:hypothetical protein LTR82_001965 [Friedmanniomyces endolithicus]|uniref:Uncharacterized protein n=1 Tax=Friedmanniomyces endolithicus TaxID=329885 RepID=A0AAN6FZJ3_9PEZI|nr:hypothetical protein LTR82_001965 [Friedmanniomyces endolithicus]
MGVFEFVQALLLAVPDRTNGDMNANPKAKQLVRLHGQDISHYPPDKPYSVSVSTCPLTLTRLPYIPAPNSPLLDPGTPHATTAPSTYSPHGTLLANWAARHAHQTVLQQHCAYWDPDSDGIVWPLDTWCGVRAWGWNIFLSALATCIIHAGLSYPSVPGGWLPDPFMRIWVRQVHKWSAVYLLLWPEDGVMRKEDVRRVFDGSIFQQKADEYAEKCAKQDRRRKAVMSKKSGY